MPAGREMVMPGDNVELVVELISPIAMEKDLRFAIREGGRTVGSGVVTQIIRVNRELIDEKTENSFNIKII